MLGKKNTLEMNEFTENENASTLTYRKGFHQFAHWRGSQKQKTFSFAQVAFAMRFKKNSLPDE